MIKATELMMDCFCNLSLYFSTVDLCQGPGSANRHQLLYVRECWDLVIAFQQEINALLTQLKDSYPTNQAEGLISITPGYFYHSGIQ